MRSSHPELALAQAKEADRLIGRRQILSQLHGVPIAVKDLCFTQGVNTASGMPLHRDFIPAIDATVVRRLREAGAVLLGKLQLTEGAFADHHPSIVPPVNPWHADHWSGASSSGSGVATAAGLCFGSIGSDTGGSIRFPSAANGTTGLKPTWGRVSRYGCFELAASLDHIGPMCRSATDAAIMLGAIAGIDADDPTTLRAEVPDYQTADDRDLRGFRVGFDEGYALSGVEPDVRRAVDEARRGMVSLGAQIVPMTFPNVDAAVADWGPHCAIETAVAHDKTFPSRRAEYGPGLAGLLDAGRAMSAGDYQRILLRRRDFTGRVHQALESVDVMLLPAQPFAAPTVARMATLGQVPAELAAPDPLHRAVQLVRSSHVDGACRVHVKGLPVAVQFVGKHLGEVDICRAGRAFQRATDWHRRHPRV